MEEENEKLDSQTNTEETTSEKTEDDLPTVDDYNALVAKNKQLFERVKKAEELAKQIKKEPTQTINKQGDYVTRDEARLYSQGYDDDDVAQLRRLAGDGKLADAVNDPLFKAYKEQKETQKLVSKAQIKSKGGGSVDSDIPVSQMTDEEHRAYFEKVTRG